MGRLKLGQLDSIDQLRAVAPAWDDLWLRSRVSLPTARATLYRRRRPTVPRDETHPKRRQPRALAHRERQAVLDVLHSSRFVDKAPAAVYATLLDEGTYHCSIRTMYRILHDHDEVRERRNQLGRVEHVSPESTFVIQLPPFED